MTRRKLIGLALATGALLVTSQARIARAALNQTQMVELPRPAGVVLGLTPSTSPVSTVFGKIVLALLTRNAIVISPDPAAKLCSAEAARIMAQAAEQAREAPLGPVVQMPRRVAQIPEVGAAGHVEPPP